MGTGVAGLLAALACLLLLSSRPASAETVVDLYPQARAFFPDADSFGPLAGSPAAAEVRRQSVLLGYLYLSADVIRIPAYSGRPINTLVGFDTRGRITGLTIVAHEEPILLAGVTEERLDRFVQQYRGRNAYDPVAVGGDGPSAIDTISGATITVMVENATVMRSLRKVAAARGISAVTLKPEQPALLLPAAPASSRSQGEQRPVQRAGSATAAVSPIASAPIPASVSVSDEPLWISVWQQRGFRIVILGGGLLFLSLVLVFQDWLVRHPSLLVYVRDGFLLYTIFFIGWYGMAQLSVVNVLTFVHSMMVGFEWESFLMDPMIFMLWAFVAMTLLLWGRGVYCGWLCPYGALQELTNQLALRFRIRQWEFPEMVHERLWAVKYIILMALFGLSLQSLGAAERFAEIEPFKTTFAMRFQREWGYVFFAIGMIAVSAINRKFYCKYLCPLGAALTFPARFRIFSWLRRRKECGSPCQVCARECEVRAINSIGEINSNECHYCLDCQVTYYNEQKCPPMVERRRRRAKSVRAREMVRGMESTLGSAGMDSDPENDGCAGCSSRDRCS